MGIQSVFAFLVMVNEAFRYTHQQTLDSSLVIIMSMLREYGFNVNQRNKVMNGDDELKDNEEYITITDFATGKTKQVKKVKSV